MNKLSKYVKENLRPLLFIVFLSLLVWYKVLNQTFLGEGYYYFDPNQSLVSFDGWRLQVYNIWQYDNFARLFFDLMVPIFRDRIILYLGAQIATISLLYLVLYYVLEKITKNKILSLTAVIFFLASYTGSFEIMATGNYQRFVQRVPNFIPAILSFYYLYQYFLNNKLKLLVASFLLYIFAVFMGYFTSFILPLFVVYPLIKTILFKPSRKKIIKGALISVFFVVLNLFLTRKSAHMPDNGILDFMLNQRGFEKTLYQLPISMIPSDIIKLIAENWIGGRVVYPYTKVLQFALIPIFAMFIYIAIKLKKEKENNLLTLYITMISSGLGAMFLYALSDRGINPLATFGAGRHYFLPTIFAGIIWAISLYALTGNKTKRYITITSFILILYVTYNTLLVWKHIDSIQYKSYAMNEVVSYIKQMSPQFTEKSVLVLPSYIMWPKSMISSLYVHPDMKFVLANEGWEKRIGKDKNKVFVLDYNLKGLRESYPSKMGGGLIDLTQQFRNGQKVTFNRN